jgi:hypothetical protein
MKGEADGDWSKTVSTISRWNRRFSKLSLTFQTGIRMNQKVLGPTELLDSEKELIEVLSLVNCSIRQHLVRRRRANMLRM